MKQSAEPIDEDIPSISVDLRPQIEIAQNGYSTLFKRKNADCGLAE